MFKALTNPEQSGWIVPLVLLLGYGFLPLGMHILLDTPYALTMFAITLVGIAGFAAGWFIRVRARLFVLSIDLRTLHYLIWCPFILFVLIAWLSAERIPLVASFQGASGDEIAVLRENFLKAREGWQHSFVYIHTVLTGALIPYSVALLFYHRSRLRWHLFFFFLIYCLSFNEKAFFFRAVIPLFFLAGQERIRIPIKTSHIALASLGILVLIAIAGGYGASRDVASSAFFSGSYATSGAVDFLIWRSVAIPVVTAVDSIRAFYQEFGGRFFHGGSSTLLAGLFNVPHVDFERSVFALQFGDSPTGTGSANSVYLVEAFINWGYWGVAIISVVVGMLFRFLLESRDCCLQALWLLLLVALFNGGFIGTMFSNGYLVLIALVFFIRVRRPAVA
jgi:hypothetical protein